MCRQTQMGLPAAAAALMSTHSLSLRVLMLLSVLPWEAPLQLVCRVAVCLVVVAVAAFLFPLLSLPTALSPMQQLAKASVSIVQQQRLVRRAPVVVLVLLAAVAAGQWVLLVPGQGHPLLLVQGSC